MKKALFLLAFVAIIFVVCGDNRPYTVLFQNDSGQTVSFNYQGYSETLSPGGSTSYEVDAETAAPTFEIVRADPDKPMPRSVTVERVSGNDVWRFKNVDALPLTVENKIENVGFTLRAAKLIDSRNTENTIHKDYIGTGDPAETELDVKKKGEATDTAVIYTSSPIFYVEATVPTAPVKVTWEAKNGGISVVIE